jgi:hypothetical protein
MEDEAPKILNDGIREAIKSKARRGRPPKAADDGDTIAMRIVRGYFPFDGSEKVLPGEVITVSKAEARVMLATGSAERADPLAL